jgi:hypothetical protein
MSGPGTEAVDVQRMLRWFLRVSSYVYPRNFGKPMLALHARTCNCETL